MSCFLTLSLSLCFLSLPFIADSVSDLELRSLIEFQKAIRNDFSNRPISWSATSGLSDPKTCPNGWRGVSCDPDTGSIIAINLDRLGLSGELKFSTLLGLTSLRNLSLSGNNFSGRVVPALGSISSLQHLDLSDNSFYGPIPKRIAGLWGLNYLNLSANRLQGGFPVGFRNLQQLKSLDLHENALWGDVGEIFTELKNVEFVDLSCNRFHGGLSMSMDNISSISNTIRHLNLSHNTLNGKFFTADSIASFKNLEILDLENNQISGELPPFGSLPSLKVLNLGRNQMFGSIPEELLQSSIPLQELDLSRNGFTGSIGEITSTTLTLLNLSSNGLSGDLPSTLKRCLVVDLSDNKLSSDISVVQTWEASPEFLDLSTNSLTGIFPVDINALERLHLLNLANNKLFGELPSDLNKLSSLKFLDLSNNSFNGQLPHKLPPGMIGFNVSYNDLSGIVPENLRDFPVSSFFPGNSKLNLPGGAPSTRSDPYQFSFNGKHHQSKRIVSIAIIIASVGAVLMILSVLFLYHRRQLKEFQNSSRDDVKTDRSSSRSSFFNFNSKAQHASSSSQSFSHEILLSSNSRSLSGNPNNFIGNHPVISGQKSSPGESPIASSSPRFSEQSIVLNVSSPDRFSGELFFLDASIRFTAKELSGAPAEVLGRSHHGTLYKATLDNDKLILNVKWLRAEFVKNKKDFAKEAKKLSSLRHPNMVSLRAYYWGPREQERLLLSDYTNGDSLELHLHETSPRRYPPLSFRQRLKIAVEVAGCLVHLHDRAMPHGNLKLTNIILTNINDTIRLTDCCLHMLMTRAGAAEHILSLGALGYCAPELSMETAKPIPTVKSDVYAYGVIVMELLTRRSAGDIISGQSGAVDLTDWVRLCDQEGRRMDCMDRDIVGEGEDVSKAMADMLAVSLRCIVDVHQRPSIRQVLDDLCSISA